MLALVPLIDPLARTWPFHPGDPAWRFLLVSLLIDHGVGLLAGLVIAFVATLLLDDRRILRRLGLTAFVLGALLLLLVVILVIDVGVTWRMLAGMLLGLAFGTLGLGTRRALLVLPERASSRRTSDRIGGV